MSTSTTKAKYIALGHSVREAVWIKRFINRIKIEVVEDLTLFGDNEMSITLTKNIESQHQTKYINIQYHYIRELVNKGELAVKWIPGLKILADGMIKALPNKTFRRHQTLLGMAVK